MKNNLPKYWVVESDDSQLFKDTVIKYLNDVYQQDWEGNEENSYYGFDGNNDECNGSNIHYYIELFQNNPILLTLDEFIELSKESVIETEFILPEKWYIKITKENQYLLNKFLHDNSKDYKGYHVNWEVEYEKNQKTYFYFPQESSNSHSSDSYYKSDSYNRTEITFDQFKKYVLNKNIDIKEESYYMVFVEGMNYPTKKHFSLIEAETEAKRLSLKENKETTILKSIITIKPKPIEFLKIEYK